MGPRGRETLFIALEVVRPRTFSVLPFPVSLCSTDQIGAGGGGVGQGGGGRGSQFSSWCFQNTGFWFLSSPLALLFISFKQPLEILGWGEGLCWRQEGPVFLPVCEMVAVWFLSLKLSI